jgi:enolase
VVSLPTFKTTRKVLSPLNPGLELCKVAIEKAGYTGKIQIAMDVAASEFYKDGKYDLDFKNPSSDPSQHLTGSALADLYRSFIADYPIVSIEDPFDQDDWEAYAELTKSVSIQIVGDDLTGTSISRSHQPYPYPDRHREKGMQRAPS